MGQCELTPVRKHNPQVSRRLATVLEKSLQVRPEDRYQSADEFKQALLGVRLDLRLRGDFKVERRPEATKAAPSAMNLMHCPRCQTLILRTGRFHLCRSVLHSKMAH